MHMCFWFDTKLQDFLFFGYSTTTLWGFLSTCLGLAALATLYETMKLVQVKLRNFVKEPNQSPANHQTNDSSSLLSRASESSQGILKFFHSYMWIKWLAEVLHWSMHVSLGYVLMLSVMTYNGYIISAVAIGSGVGYYIFGPIWFEWNITKIQRRKRLIKCNPDCADAIIEPLRNDSTSSMISSHMVEEGNIDAEVEVHYKDETEVILDR